MFYFFLLCYCFGNVVGENPVPVVPFPQQVTLLADVRRWVDKLELQILPDDPTLLEDKVISSSIKRYSSYFASLPSPPNKSKGIPIVAVSLTVKDPDAPLKIGMNESYAIEIPPTGNLAYVSAETRFGIVRGLETLYQLFNVTDGTWPSVEIRDWPRFAYRGFLIDTSRHFLPVHSIIRMIKGLSFAKYNVLHWHIVDDPSFPYHSEVFPSLSQKGAYSPSHVYSRSDIRNVISFAEDHAMVVVPEFDTPGHVNSWGKALPGFTTYCPGRGAMGTDYGPADPTREENYVILEKLFTEITTLFPSAYVHLGGDEVPFGCWAANPNVTAWMKAHKITTYPALENYWEDRLLEIIHKMNHSYVVWQEIFNNGLKIAPETIVHVWKSKNWQPVLANVVKGGFRAIVSAPWYLNYIAYGEDWQNFYKVEPLDIPATDKEKKLVIGGEACMWGEYVDVTNVLSRTFPRASAPAERLWSSAKQVDMADMTERMDKHRCGMCARNLPAQSANNRGFCPIEYKSWEV